MNSLAAPRELRDKLRSLPVLYTVAAACFLLLMPGTGRAQGGGDRVVVLPFISRPADSLMACTLHGQFLSGIRKSPFLSVITQEQVSLTLRYNRLHDVLSSASRMQDYTESAGAGFLIGGVVQRTGEGGISVTTALYGRGDGAILAIRSQTYADSDQASSLVPQLARDFTHPRQFSIGDEAFFYSLILPGSGQLRLGRWDHALLSVGLIGSAILYGVTAPEPDRYEIPFGSFRQEWDRDSILWRFYAAGREVSHDEYFEAYEEAVLRQNRSRKEVAAASARRTRAGTLTLLAWLFNLADTLFISRQHVNGAPFFELVNSVQMVPALDPAYLIRLGVRLPLAGGDPP